MSTKLQPDLPASQFSITSHGPGFLSINGSRFSTSIIVTPDSPPQAWDCGHPNELGEQHFAALRALQPELILLGTGPVQVMPSPRLMASLMSRSPAGEPAIGIEVMDTAAACRTFNLLAAEGRRVLAALIIQAPEEKSNEPDRP